MQHSPHAPAPIDGFAARLIKRSMLVLLGPAYFLFIAFVPLLCARRKGFRGWYWRKVKRSCSHLLWLLGVRAEMSSQDQARLATDENSIIVINHRSHLDGFALMHVVPDAKWFTFAAKKELCDAKLLSTGFNGAGLVPIDRASGSVAMETLTQAVREMPSRRSVVLFPEGTRTKAEKLGEFKAGAVLVARDTGRSITPIVIHDSDVLLPRGKSIPASGVIHIEVLPPFVCDPTATVDADVTRLRDAMVAAFDARRANPQP
ncbi:1-acyl-sn-glycerol-3-phosphate acyltransferase [Sulfitobacter sp. M57]|uniref:lysophospholipid acyltransferase family protein n=1 Tax=unclassified Sulfitobacter TaxID=196795 RepID=UPI0023E18804|nr:MULTISPECIES: lysophospholipid acyltransferase family protein [unclassified Sulfitobacter]MDF3414098.1 1-acyl-sn-glycerol-3-phosphate acyltransferase [Sulfitobacter sp. KE5]MDF3420621.1 1-acyl-sn-glycerol-3-phosphate acyltransferase [Sulfitobacter sp. KE43]MDF3432644.1 1-acyl-sn-glycerol-3-phosphate acyltransferase [Sulfitobacter sp. KE42]MDF3458283.1 1-acyl-sn-glycerol-3-phosphate acyltransferase [Sulfitobacter sp. S74]MDF3462184.1 1-acyl-sn-glycerol-3-phosphate acyltransferase [Sulfitobac